MKLVSRVPYTNVVCGLPIKPMIVYGPRCVRLVYICKSICSSIAWSCIARLNRSAKASCLNKIKVYNTFVTSDRRFPQNGTPSDRPARQPSRKYPSPRARSPIWLASPTALVNRAWFRNPIAGLETTILNSKPNRTSPVIVYNAARPVAGTTIPVHSSLHF